MRCHNASTVLIRALAFVDSCVLFTIAMSHILVFVKVSAARRAVWYLYNIARVVSIWTPVLVGAHRYIAVCKPLMAARMCTASKARRHFVGVLVFSAIVNIPVCFTSPSPWFGFVYYDVFLLALMKYIIPVVSLFFITVRLVQSLQSSRRLRRMDLGEGQRQCQTDRMADLMVIVVLIVFIVCHTSSVMYTLVSSYMISPYLKTLQLFCQILILLNSSVNCIIYIVFNRNFRRTLCQCSQPVANQPSVSQEPERETMCSQCVTNLSRTNQQPETQTIAMTGLSME